MNANDPIALRRSSWPTRLAAPLVALAVTHGASAHGQSAPPRTGDSADGLSTWVHMESDDPAAELTRDGISSSFVTLTDQGALVGTIATWDRICNAPCDQSVPSEDAYRIRGTDVVVSDALRLPPGGVRLRVHTGRVSAQFGAFLVGLVGTGAAVTGIAMLSLVPAAYSDDAVFGGTGAALLVGGGGILAAGIWLGLRHRTFVTVSPVESPDEMRRRNEHLVVVDGTGVHF